MKKALTLLLALVLVFALFAGCGDKTTGGDETPTGDPATNAPAETNAPPQETQGGEEGPYNLAAGKYEVDDNGVPLEQYVYELPLTTSDEVITLWTSPVLVDIIPEDGMGALPYQAEIRNRTGVNIEYIAIAGAYPGPGPRQDNFSVLLASDDLPDMVTNADWYYPGTLQSAVDDGYFVNLYDYKEYFPNYYLAANSHPDDPNVMAKIMPQEETIYAFWTLEYEPVALHNMATRGDWLEKLGLTNDDVVTMDDWFNMLKGFQTEVGIESPYLLYSTLDAHGGFSCFDTHCAVSLTSIAYPVIENGAVAFSNTREEDKNFLTMINQWWNEGFITPLWQSAIGNANVTEQIYNGEIGVIGMVPGEAGDYEDLATDPNAEWVPLHKPVLEEGQVFHLGDQRSWISYGSWFINADCANIPLAATWCDYFYSEEGIFFSNYGVEGVSFEYDEDGKPMLTEFITENPGGLSWAIMSYAMCEIIDGGVSIRNRSYAYPGGERIAGFHTYWIDPDYYRYDASMEWPSAVTFTNEENSTISQYANDITTYISENYILFIDGSKPLSEWDSYVSGVMQLNLNECIGIYQAAYDRFAEKYIN